MKLTNNHGLSSSIVHAIEQIMGQYDPGRSDITVTGLISPPQQRRLMQEHADELSEDIMECSYRIMGSSAHYVMENAASCDEANICEERYYSHFLNGVVVGGQVDLIEPNEGHTLSDYKITSVYAVKEPKPEWIAQLNILALLAKENGVKIERLKIVAFLRDWSKAAKEKQDKAGFPYPNPIVEMDIPMWNDEHTTEYVLDRLRAHYSDDTPPCSPEERWAKPDTWAVLQRKKGKWGVRAMSGSVSDTKVMAESFINEFVMEGADVKDFKIDFRPGKSNRCEDYCAVNKWCKQYKEMNNDKA